MSKKAKILITALIVILGVILFIPGNDALAYQTVITVWHPLPGEYSPLFEKLLNTYPEKTNGLVQLNIRRFDTADELHQALLSGEDKPDVALIETRWQEEIDRVSPLVYMEDLIREKVGSSVFIVFKMDTFSQMWDSSMKNGKLMSLPFTGYNRALIINNDILGRYTDKRPQVWQDIVDIGKSAIKKAQESNEEIPMAFLIPNHATPMELAEFFQVMLWQMDRCVFEPFMDGELVAFDGPEGKQILSLMVDMIHKHRVSPGVPVDKSQVAMFIGTPMDYLNMKEQGADLQVIRWPGNKHSRNNLTVYGFVVFQGPDDEKLDKIWHLIYDASAFASSAQWALSTPFLPQNKQVTLSPGYFVYVKSFPGITRFVQQVTNSRVGKLCPRKARVMQMLGENIKMCLANQISVDKCIEASAKHANMILDPDGHLRSRKEKMKSISSYVDKVWEKDY